MIERDSSRIQLCNRGSTGDDVLHAVTDPSTRIERFHDYSFYYGTADGSHHKAAVGEGMPNTLI